MNLIILSICLFFLTLYGCSSSTGSRYETKDDDEIEIIEDKTTDPVSPNEEFDMTPYMEDFDIKEVPENVISTDKLDLWFNYEVDSSTADSTREIVDQVDGFRVQVIATDDLEEANRIKSEIYSRTNQKSVYIIFDPPFYKVKTGDFTEIADARNLSFQLNQLGYKESRVITEKVNIYK